jgi:hypothetical protein
MIIFRYKYIYHILLSINGYQLGCFCHKKRQGLEIHVVESNF